MNLEQIKFNDPQAQRVYKQYLDRVKRATRKLGKDDQMETMMEFNSHIYEAKLKGDGGNELDQLLNIIDDLGAPEEILKPLVADKEMEKATRTFNPLHIVRALGLNIFNGVAYMIFAILYLLLFSFVFLVFAKLFNPESVGLFFNDEGFQVLGMTTAEIATREGLREVLGAWFIPVMLLSMVVFYFIITLLLRLYRSVNKR